MPLRPFLFSLGVVSLLFNSYSRGADPLADPKDDPLPEGAKLRLGSGRLVSRYTPGFTLAPPEYNTILVPEVTGGVRRFDVTTGLPLDPNIKEAIAGGQVVVSGDGKRAVVQRTGILIVKEVGTGNVVRELRPPPRFSTIASGTLPTAVLSGDGKILAQGGQANTGKGEVIVWDVDKGAERSRIQTIYTGPIHPVISSDGKWLAIWPLNPTFVPPGKTDTDVGRSIQVWDIENQKELFKAKLQGPGNLITAVAFSPDNSILAASCGDGMIELWDVKTRKSRPPILGRTGQGLRVAFSPDGKTLAAIASDGAIQQWSVIDGKPTQTTKGPADLPVVQGVAFTGNQRVVAWGAHGQRMMVWESGKLLSPAFEHSASIKSIAFAAEGKEVVTSSFDGTVVRWDAATGKFLGYLIVHPARYQIGINPIRVGLNLSPDATRAITLSSPSTVVFDLKTGEEQFVLPRGPVLTGGYNSSAVSSADLSKIAVLTIPYDQKKKGTCTVWDLTTRQKIIELELNESSTFNPTAAFTPSGSRLVTALFSQHQASGQNVMVVSGWDLKTGKKLGEVEDVNAGMSVSIAAANETSAVVMSASGRLRLFDFESGRGGDEIETAKLRNEAVGPIAFSKDGKIYATGFTTDEQGVYGIRVYDWARGVALHTFSGLRAPVSALAFSPDEKTLVSGAQDSTVVVWDLSALTKPK